MNSGMFKAKSMKQKAVDQVLICKTLNITINLKESQFPIPQEYAVSQLENLGNISLSLSLSLSLSKRNSQDLSYS